MPGFNRRDRGLDQEVKLRTMKIVSRVEALFMVKQEQTLTTTIFVFPAYVESHRMEALCSIPLGDIGIHYGHAGFNV